MRKIIIAFMLFGCGSGCGVGPLTMQEDAGDGNLCPMTTPQPPCGYEGGTCCGVCRATKCDPGLTCDDNTGYCVK